MKILLTGCAGFIGFHLATKLLLKKHFIVGIDNMNNYYDVNLKFKRLKNLKKNKNFSFHKTDLKNKDKIYQIFKKHKFDVVINLAAQAGVRYSLTNPDQYIYSNVLGFYNLLEAMKKYKVKKLLYASSSSVYGSINSKSFHEGLLTNKQISLYATSKKINEVFMDYYGKIFDISSIGMRFFTVYGPLGRPDMSIYKFTESILNNKKIYLHNFGDHSRDFTYVDDTVLCVEKLMLLIKKTKINTIVNIAGGKRISIKKIVSLLEKKLNKKAKVAYKPLQFGDVKNTFSNPKKLKSLIGYIPQTPIDIGLDNFCNWFKKNN
jgi:UDP-glucuronate 4-epimerase